MKKEWNLTEEVFDKFLLWLHPDRAEAGKKYESIRRHLILIFNCRGCADSEALADETIDRVIRRSQVMADTYIGDPAPYFITVAHNLYHNYASKRSRLSELDNDLPQQPDPDPDDEKVYQCLDSCMQHLAPASASLVLEYYKENKKAKIDNRKKLADQLGIGTNALRIRAHRIRGELQRCINECLTVSPVPEMD